MINEESISVTVECPECHKQINLQMPKCVDFADIKCPNCESVYVYRKGRDCVYVYTKRRNEKYGDKNE